MAALLDRLWQRLSGCETSYWVIGVDIAILEAAPARHGKRRPAAAADRVAVRARRDSILADSKHPHKERVRRAAERHAHIRAAHLDTVGQVHAAAAEAGVIVH